TIKERYFMEKIAVDALEEDEIIATEFMDAKVLEQSGLNLKKIIGEAEKENLKKLGLAEVPVYRNAPRFGPFIFAGTMLALAAPQFFAILFLSV
ncbi:MAG: hypothetical protein Q7R47_03985, partial [Candidatus Diapherotrites archaeon]|nr:hypothetical protein [Candidatus Diapherotrites archaeon]